MRIRLAIACSVAAALTLPVSPVSAAPKKKARPKPPPPVCHLLVDDRGDGEAKIGGPLVNSAALDITGGDIATGKKNIVGVLRVATTNTAVGPNDPWPAFAMEWQLVFQIKNEWFNFRRFRRAGPEPRYTYDFDGFPVTNVKETATEIRWTIPRSMLPQLKNDKVIRTINASSGWFMSNADAASTMKTYKDQTPSCLKAT